MQNVDLFDRVEAFILHEKAYGPGRCVCVCVCVCV
jgi:hypothetical protein